MAQVIVTESSLENIAGAIRAKLGTQATYKPAQMAGAIAQIHGDPVLEALNVNANGTYTPSSGKDGFSQAVVNVPNTYLLSDEGKVVSGGALVAQSTQSITQNGTYDTTLKNQVTVNVSGGGGGSTILSGIDAPTASVGSDGDIYLEYVDTPVKGYLQNTGSSYINTNYAAKSNSRFVMECNITGGSTNAVPFGARGAASAGADAKGVYTIRGDSNKFGYCFGTALTQVSGTNFNDFLNKDVTITLSNSLAKITDGTDTLEYSFVGGTPTTYPIFLFGLNQAGTNLSACYCYMKLYRFKIYEDDELVADYVPAIEGGTAGIRNLINSRFIGVNGAMNVVPYEEGIVAAFCKVDGAWQSLIGTDIDDVNT